MELTWRHIVYQKYVFLASSLAPNSLSTYQTGLNHYIKFCQLFNIVPIFPLSESVLENFCVYLQVKVAYKSIKVYLCGVQYWSYLNGYNEEIADMDRLHYVLQGIRRSQGGSRDRPQRPPISWNMLTVICDYIATTYTRSDGFMLTAAVLLAYFGMLRISEYTIPGQNNFDPSAHLTVNDVTILRARRVAQVFLKKSKTDPFRKGVAIRVGVLNHRLCPVKALIRYLVVRGPKPGPLFLFSNGIFLTRAHIHDILIKSLPDVPFVNTHSFRSGGATALANAGIPAYVIQILGRWKSRAYATYVQYSDKYIITVNQHMTN